MQVEPTGRIIGFEEKPDNPQAMPGQPDQCLASMGIYVFSARLLFELLLSDANNRHSAHDFGKNIIPAMIGSHRVFAFPFLDENRKTQAYWRDVGTIDSYYAANMDLISVDPQLNIGIGRFALTRETIRRPSLSSRIEKRRARNGSDRRPTVSSARGQSSRVAKSAAALLARMSESTALPK
jgi:ADP-glucose pyrophosphorylase